MGEPNCLYTMCQKTLPLTTSTRPLESMAPSQTPITLAEDSPSLHLQALLRRTLQLRRWRVRRCAAEPSSATWPSPGRVVGAEVAVVAEVEEVLGVAAEGVEEECPYLQVEGAPE